MLTNSDKIPIFFLLEISTFNLCSTGLIFFSKQVSFVVS